MLLPSTKDSAQTTLSSGINASVLTIPVTDGSVFPQPYNGTCSSTGSSTALNDTGDLGDLAVDDIIRNVTDGSWAIVTSIAGAPDAITTTRLQGGTLNVWTSGDVWRVNEFLLTVDDGDVNGENISNSEKMLISDRSGNSLTVPSGGRGYDGSTGLTFASGVYARLNVTSLTIENMKDAIGDMAEWNNTNQTSIESNDTDISNLQVGSYHYVVATGSSSAYVAATPALSAYAAGNIIRFKANHTNTGASTLNVNSLGAKTIKKLDGATDLAANDIINGQIVTVVYDGTYLQMVSPLGQVANQDLDVLNSNSADSSEAGTSSTSEENFDVNYSIPSTVWAAGNVVRATGVVRAVTNNSDSFTLRVKIGSTTLISQAYTNSFAGVRSVPLLFRLTIVCLTTGSSGTYTYWGEFFAPSLFSDHITATNEYFVADGIFRVDTSTDTTTPTNTLDMDTSNTLQASIQYGGSSANNAARLQRLIVEKLAVN